MMDTVKFCPNGKDVLVGNELYCFSRASRYLEFGPSLTEAHKLLETNARNVSALSTLGNWWAFRGRDAWAVELLEKARANGGRVSALTLARCYWNLDRTDDARREFRRAIDEREAPEPYLRLCLNAVGKTWPAAATRPATRPAGD